MKRGDGKSKFYRTLNLDKEDWKVIKEFNKLKEKMINENIKDINKENNEFTF